MEEVRFIPPLPTLWPNMLRSRRGTNDFPPFSSGDAHYFYFARNAVWLTVKLFGLEGAEVLVPSYHHGVEIEALVDAGAQPTFYRVGRRWDVDLADVERRITPRTRALYLVHYAGFPGPWAAMRALADKHGLKLIEDCALSLLSGDGDVPLGSAGDASIYCLYKTLPVPNGGALVLNGDKPYAVPEAPEPPLASTWSHLASSLLQNVEFRAGAVGRLIRSSVRALGRGTVSAAKIERVATGTQHFERKNVDLGISPTTLRIAAGLDLPAIVEARRRNYFHLMSRLREVAPPLFSTLAPGVCPLFYPLVVEDKAPVMAALAARGIETVDFWRDFHPACSAVEFPDTAWLRRSIVEIPCHQDLSAEHVTAIARAVVEVVQDTHAPRRIHAGH